MTGKSMAGVREMVDWLQAGPVRLPSGAYLSWVGDDDSAAVYPEAAAVAIRTICWWSEMSGKEDLLLRLIPTLAFLEESVSEDGLIWHRGRGWLFDSLLSLCAFETAQRLGVPYASNVVIERLATGCTRMLDGRCATQPRDGERWSTSFGPHLLKPVSLLVTAGMGPAQLREAIHRALPGLISSQDSTGAFRYSAEGPVYLHAHCYALEGLSVLGEAPEALHKGLAYLLSQRRPDGGFGRWSNAQSPKVADVTAQAGRLFLLAGRREDAGKAREALDDLMAPSGALYYHAESKHENSWSTAFAAQLDHGLMASLKATDLA